jgi:hypothetical protein
MGNPSFNFTPLGIGIIYYNSHKHIRLVISDNGSWGKHIDMITGKAYKRINILRKFRFILDRKTLEKI